MLSGRTTALLTLCALLVSAGCRPEEQITRYSAPKQPKSTSGRTPSSPASEPGRMLGAIIPQGEKTWFVKLTGPTDDVAQHRSAFDALLAGWSFADGKPKWELPPGWNESPGNEFRFATLKVSAAPKIDVSVTVLPTAEGDPEEYALLNVNRWRKQMELPPFTLEELRKDDEEHGAILHQEIAGAKAIVIDFTGTLSAASMPRGPFAAGGKSPTVPQPPAPRAPSAGLTFEKPEAWADGKAGGMRKAAFIAHSGSDLAEITVIDLPAAANDLLGNVNRWRGQVGLPAVTAEELPANVQQVPLADGTGDFVELVAPAEAEKPQTILGVVAVRGDKAWFIKLQGESALAAQEKQRFLDFVKSMKFSQSEGNGDGQ